MIKEVVSILNNSAALQALFDGMNRIYPYTTDYLGDCVIYQVFPQSDNKAVNKIRIQISIIADTLDKALSVESIIKKLLLTIGDEPLTQNILQVEQNGGGSLFDYGRNKYHHYMYFDITGRSEIIK